MTPKMRKIFGNIPEQWLMDAHSPKYQSNQETQLRKSLTTFGTKWLGIRLETQELISDCSMPQSEPQAPGPNADTHQLLSHPHHHQASSCTPISPSMLQSAIPLNPSRWPNPVTSYLSSASNGLIS